MLLSEITIQAPQIAQNGIGLGSALAIVLSWERNRSIFWAILAGVFSWFYVIHFGMSRKPEENRK